MNWKGFQKRFGYRAAFHLQLPDLWELLRYNQDKPLFPYFQKLYSHGELHGNNTLVIYIRVFNKCIIQTYLCVVALKIVIESAAQKVSITLLFDRNHFIAEIGLEVTHTDWSALIIARL